MISSKIGCFYIGFGEGNILVGPETASRIGKEIPLLDRGIMHFKNVREGIRVYSLVRPS